MLVLAHEAVHPYKMKSLNECIQVPTSESPYIEIRFLTGTQTRPINLSVLRQQRLTSDNASNGQLLTLSTNTVTAIKLHCKMQIKLHDFQAQFETKCDQLVSFSQPSATS